MAKAEVLEVLGRRPFEARTGMQAAGGSSFVFEVRTGEVKNTDTQFTDQSFVHNTYMEWTSPLFHFLLRIGDKYETFMAPTAIITVHTHTHTHVDMFFNCLFPELLESMYRVFKPASLTWLIFWDSQVISPLTSRQDRHLDRDVCILSSEWKRTGAGIRNLCNE